MKKKTILCIVLILLTCAICLQGCASPKGQQNNQKPPIKPIAHPEAKSTVPVRKPIATFFLIHFETGATDQPWTRNISLDSDVRNLKYQEALWPTAVKLVDLANQYSFHLTLAFNPQWAEYILKDPAKVQIVKGWQQQGHEVAFHYHSFEMDDWCGFSDDRSDRVLHDLRYRGTLPDGLGFVRELASPQEVVTGTTLLIHTGGGKDNPSDARKKPEIIPMWGKQVPFFSHGRLMVNGAPPNWQPIDYLKEFKQEYAKTQEDEAFGVVIHCHDFHYRQDVVEQWFRFISSQGDSIQSVNELSRKFFPEYSLA